jgi:hypothetical protein
MKEQLRRLIRRSKEGEESWQHVMAPLQQGQREHRARAEEKVRKQRQQRLSSPRLRTPPSQRRKARAGRLPARQTWPATYRR